MAIRVEARINLEALSHNHSVVRQTAPNSRIAAVVKADAYGHGLLTTIRALADADAFAVARMDEAINLRLAGVSKPIIVLSGATDLTEIHAAIDFDLSIVIHHQRQLQLFLSQTWPKPMKVWLKMDSGMHRLGLPPEDYRAAYQRLRQHPSVADIVCMTHLSSADELHNPRTSYQVATFANHLPDNQLSSSIANSAAIIAWPETHQQWVRPGLMLYGVSPLNEAHPIADQLMPVMTLQSQIIAINHIGAGEPVGYNQSWYSHRPTRIGVVAMGYGDGYPRHAPSGTPVLIQGRRAPIIGRVSMDLITVDLTDMADVQSGETVTLWGQGLPITEIAAMAGTIPYELLTGLTGRVHLVYEREPMAKEQHPLHVAS